MARRPPGQDHNGADHPIIFAPKLTGDMDRRFRMINLKHWAIKCSAEGPAFKECMKDEKPELCYQQDKDLFHCTRRMSFQQNTCRDVTWQYLKCLDTPNTDCSKAKQTADYCYDMVI